MKQVILIEDNHDIIDILSRWLEREHCLVVALSDGLEAIGFLSKKVDSPQVVILDLILPERSGLELLSSIKSKWPEAKVFVFSGSIEYVERLPEGSTDGVFFKADGIQPLMSSVHYALQSY